MALACSYLVGTYRVGGATCWAALDGDLVTPKRAITMEDKGVVLLVR